MNNIILIQAQPTLIDSASEAIEWGKEVSLGFLGLLAIVALMSMLIRR